MSFLLRLWKNNIVKLIVVTVLTLIFFRYLLPLLLPFFIAFFFVLIFHPVLKKIKKKLHIPEGILAGAVLLFMATGILVGAWFLVCRFMEFIGEFQTHGRELMDSCGNILDSCCVFLGDKMHMNPEMIKTRISNGAESFMISIRKDFAPKALDASYSYAGSVFDAVFTIVMSVIAILLLARDYDEIKDKLSEYKWFAKLREMSRKILTVFKIYIKAQLVIVLCVSATAATGLFACGTERWFLLGILTGVLDTLPFIGSGIVLLPVAIFSFIRGKVWQGIGGLAVYGICVFLRQILEPKLIGNKMNMYPIVVLLSVFFGLQFFSIGGIVLGPLSLFLIREIYQEVKE